MSVEVYLEDGPKELAGSTHVHSDAPPELTWMVPRISARSYYTDPDPAKFHEPIPTDTLVYHRERAPHRIGVVCYWLDPEARDRAMHEDLMEDPRDVGPTGMLSACQSAL